MRENSFKGHLVKQQAEPCMPKDLELAQETISALLGLCRTKISKLYYDAQATFP